jgi:outer membrane protein OmpA-like peptidoglycan-associated protein
MKVEISAHTDNRGSDAYNLQLSQKRAESVVNYLISKGIAANRIIAKGYGESKPLASNDDEAEGRELNRRVEFEVLSK